MRYAELVAAYEAIEATTKRLEMTGLLVDLLKDTVPEDVGAVVYLTQGQLGPSFEAVEFGLAEKLVVKGLAQAAGTTPERVMKVYQETGDLGLAAERVRGRARQATLFGPARPAHATGAPGAEAPLTVGEVFAKLRAIAEASGGGSQEAKLRLLNELLARVEPKEARYLVRTVTGKLRLGVADMSILDALAVLAAFPDAPAVRSVTELTEEERARLGEAKALLERAYNLSSDLGRVARAVRGGGLAELRRVAPTPGVPLRPMLAERLPTAEEILAKTGGRCAVEYKYDGLRLQGHLTADGQAHFFSRRLEDMTPQFPDVAAALREAFRGRQAIVEGEAVGVDEAGDLLPFEAVTHRRGRKHDLEAAIARYPVAMHLFDLLHLDGEDYTTRPLEERRAALERSFTQGPRVRFSHYEVVERPDALEKFFEQAVADGAEGILAKALGPEAVYRAGARGWQWIKLKRDYRAEMTDALDLVVVGAFHGRGRRAGWYGALLMAAYNPAEDTFETVCKLGTGFSDEFLDALPARLEPHRIGHAHPRVRSGLVADVWFSPAVVWEVVGAELTLSPVHRAAWDRERTGAGLAVRFPRYTGRWREDKSPEDATTTDELVAMYRRQARKPAA